MRKEFDEYLNIWAKQLLREHFSICWQYDLKLPRPAIEIVETSSYWGQWRQSHATISIAIDLIINKQWDVVLNVLKHEMAHQMVSEQNGNPGHGKDFQKACQVLGLPSPFCKASGDLPETFDSSSKPGLPETGRVLEKIRKLLALGDSANEHESLLAIRKAKELMARHKLDRFSAMAKQGCCGRLINLKRKRLESYHRALCSILQEHFQVEIIIVPLYDAINLASYKNIDLVGRADNVRIAEYVFHFLLDRLNILWQAKKDSGPSTQKKSRNSYWLGVLNGFREGLRKESSPNLAAVQDNIHDGHPTSFPVTGEDQALRSFISERHPKLRTGRHSKARIDRSSFESGLKDGRLLKLRRGLKEQKKKPAIHRLPILPTGG